MTIKFYERTPEQQAFLGYLVDPSQVGGTGDGVSEGDTREAEPHGSVGARAGRRAIAQGNSTEMAEALFRYSAPEEVNHLSEVIFKKTGFYLQISQCFVLVGIGNDFPLNMWSLCYQVRMSNVCYKYPLLYIFSAHICGLPFFI